MLLTIRDFIKREKVVSTQHLAREFHIEEHALQPMLDIWVNKGVIELCQDKDTCKSACMGCKIGRPQFYQHVLRAAAGLM